MAKPVRIKSLCRRLRRYYLRETAYSVIFPKWSTGDCKRILAYSKYPVVINDVANIVITLERHYDCPRSQAIKLAKKIQKRYGKRVKKYMRRYFNTGTREQVTIKLKRKRALKEQRARGFINWDDADIDTSLPYIASNIKNIVWPKQYKFKQCLNMGGVYEKFQLIGVSGYTGIRMPKKYRR